LEGRLGKNAARFAGASQAAARDTAIQNFANFGIQHMPLARTERNSKFGVARGAVQDQPSLLVRMGGQCTSTGSERWADGFRGTWGVGDIGIGFAIDAMDLPRIFSATVQGNRMDGARGGIITFERSNKNGSRKLKF
jgi:hypothetical protein